MGEGPFAFRAGADIDARRISAEAIGEPGERRFRVLVILGDETFVIWMEKQQLQALGMALEQLLEQVPSTTPDLGETGAPLPFDTDTRYQFRAGRIELGYDERRDRLVIVAHDILSDQEEVDPAPSFSCRITRAQARELIAIAEEVVAAGRPRCTMCGAPMGPEPHACPQQNGHLPHLLGDNEAEEEDTPPVG